MKTLSLATLILGVSAVHHQATCMYRLYLDIMPDNVANKELISAEKDI